MEYVDGKSISQIIQKLQQIKRVFDQTTTCIIGCKVAKALHYAHTKIDSDGNPLKIVHRDVTPGNILINTYGVVKLGDFGIAKALNSTGPDEKKMIMGKLPYMSPEQINAMGTDYRTDIFTLGLVMYEMLTCKRVYEEIKNRKDLIHKMNSYRIIGPRKINPHIYPELEAIIMKCLRSDPKDRYQSALDLQNDLKLLLYSNGFINANEVLMNFMRRTFSNTTSLQNS